MARYRSFGINPSDGDLPPEAVTDLDRLRTLLERMAAQAREITNENVRAYDALALQEDVLGIRLSLTRDAEDREKWEGEYAAAREQLAAAQVKIASIGRIPSGAASPKVTRSVPTAINNEASPSPKETPPATVSASSPQSQPATGPGGAESKDSERRTVNTGALNGREKKHVNPAYPRTAKATGASGVVKVYVIVDEKGKVTVTNSEGPTLLREAAETAARGWSFLPTVFDGKPVRISGYINFEFKL
jgi:TonB family protein